jgi:D-3-phosphoglycerate dehydrogenase / 2-oxoglutarate reductase
MTATVLYADAHLFPFTDADQARADAAGLRLIPIDGHRPDDFRGHSDAVALVAWGGPYNDAVFDVLPELTILARCGAGFDNIDRAAAARRGIALSYAPGQSDDEVAEHAFALLLCVARKIVVSDRAVRDGAWPSAADLAPMSRIHGSRLGLLGFGRIGQALAWRARAFGMHVTAMDPYQSDDTFATTGVARRPDIASLLADCDYVSLHLPGTDDHRPVLGRAELDQLRPGTVVINTARGSLVDTAALVDGLRDGRIGAAGLDVVDPEPLPADHPLLALSNVVITPHSAAFSNEALAGLRTHALDNIIAVLRGDPPLTPIPDEV